PKQVRWPCGGAGERPAPNNWTPCAAPRRWSACAPRSRPCRPHATAGWCWTGRITPAAGWSSCGATERRPTTAGAPAGPPGCAATGRGPQRRRDSVIAADEADQLALHRHLVGAEDLGLVVSVGRLQRDRGALFAQALESGLFALDKGHDDLAGNRLVAGLDDHQVAVEDA